MNLLIIQARMGSTRLPGKVLKKIGEKSLLEILLERVRPSARVDKIVVATTTNGEDDGIEELCTNMKVACYRGSEWDVLDRFYQAAKPFNPDNVVRVTADCPLQHNAVIDFVVGEYLKSGCDYFSNSNHEPDFVEDGFDTEVFSFAALETAWKDASLLSEREHVTPYIKNSGKFSCGWKRYNSEFRYKLSVDTENDFRAIKAIFDKLEGQVDFGMNEVVELLQRHPEIVEINKESTHNEGYRASLSKDRKIK